MLSRLLKTLLLLSALTTAHHAYADIKDVDVEEFDKLITSGGGIILDVRTPDEVAQGHLPNASVLNIYDDAFLKKLNLMQKNKPIYVYCRSGGRSAKAAAIMKENGFKNIYNLLGGIGAWKSAKKPIIKPDDAPKAQTAGITLKVFKKALKENNKVLAAFKTEWCAPCRQMDPILDALKAELSGKVHIIKIDLDASPKLAESYSINGVPVFIFFENGQESWRHSGVLSKESLKSKI